MTGAGIDPAQHYCHWCLRPARLHHTSCLLLAKIASGQFFNAQSCHPGCKKLHENCLFRIRFHNTQFKKCECESESLGKRNESARSRSHSRPFSVPGAGIEPAQHCCHWCLRPARLPIPPSGHFTNLVAIMNLT
jgi:hypothetical protein